MRRLRMWRSGTGRRWSVGEPGLVLFREERLTPIYTDEHRLEAERLFVRGCSCRGRR